MNKRDHLQALREADAYMEKVKDEVQKHPWRQDYHYSPTVGWINDPCGLVQIDGYYHMLCQHYPFSGAWGIRDFEQPDGTVEEIRGKPYPFQVPGGNASE